MSPRLTPSLRRLPNNIRIYRRRRHLLVKEVLMLMRLRRKYPSAVSKWEKGRCLPTLVNALWLSAVIDCPIEVLFLEHFQAIRAMVNRRRASVKLKYPGF